MKDENLAPGGGLDKEATWLVESVCIEFVWSYFQPIVFGHIP